MDTLSGRAARPTAAWFFALLCACSGVSVHAPSPAEGSPADGATVLQFDSSVDAGHSHRVTLSASELARPPVGGIARQTTRSGGHFHRLVLTEAEMRAIHAGRTIVKETSPSDGHTHRFTFRLR